ncbi:hypothetical protein SGQ44_03110 [Flavobacterium sp. Fl-77]|uniref:Uncharacterized protein n=1 Tax=Flavobacterium flavipigmentatum TaxID=2893884 RepID=A0AAJ2S582_9FLAO|nr:MULTISPECIES: hypothetical protein [unclassified Flavobacterium]MDX6181127.1 hypothetical protein [Flavobacterium sp. Fl-33]MDX6184728.1 hypothetical protein [Flavobacterium sp. Fl-77]UFH39827.1 hypothetical protein LNP22_06005 [Flavobacterium sp. F-70]
MKTPKLLILIFLLLGEYVNAQNKIDQFFKIKIEQSLISRGDNFPDFRIEKDSLDVFLFTLHKGYTPNDFQNFTKFKDEKMSNLISLLKSKNWLHQINNQYKPTVFIADSKDGKLLYKYAKPISKKITKSITKNLSEIKSQFDKTEISKKQNFQKWSFLILSDVLLDSWQIDNVEKDFLKQEDRPLRHGNHYYYKISENTNPQIESFGIYGNQSQKSGDRYNSVYGNNRLNLRISSSENLISRSDNKIFDEMAKIYLPDLLKILEEERNYSKKVYAKLGYDKEISFEEFFIWWYHFIYTQSTDEMNKKGILTIPADGNFDYVTED